MYILNRWEKRRTPQGREYFINHYTHTTQWNKPLRYWFYTQVNNVVYNITSCIYLCLYISVRVCMCV